jgi:hypothetical protein
MEKVAPESIHSPKSKELGDFALIKQSTNFELTRAQTWACGAAYTHTTHVQSYGS